MRLAGTLMVSLVSSSISSFLLDKGDSCLSACPLCLYKSIYLPDNVCHLLLHEGGLLRRGGPQLDVVVDTGGGEQGQVGVGLHAVHYVSDNNNFKLNKMKIR